MRLMIHRQLPRASIGNLLIEHLALLAGFFVGPIAVIAVLVNDCRSIFKIGAVVLFVVFLVTQGRDAKAVYRKYRQSWADCEKYTHLTDKTADELQLIIADLKARQEDLRSQMSQERRSHWQNMREQRKVMLETRIDAYRLYRKSVRAEKKRYRDAKQQLKESHHRNFGALEAQYEAGDFDTNIAVAGGLMEYRKTHPITPAAPEITR